MTLQVLRIRSIGVVKVLWKVPVYSVGTLHQCTIVFKYSKRFPSIEWTVVISDNSEKWVWKGSSVYLTYIRKPHEWTNLRLNVDTNQTQITLYENTKYQQRYILDQWLSTDSFLFGGPNLVFPRPGLR